ncbi:AAA family ATPase [Salinibacterium soli]|uniref:AAA family ATPase n=1 Tax=Antiquaquibacter soli TaxID=3064523 RepID=A0ABT9BMF5_9MICO|nr:AAA family ATPase [Protaetiibacter sp. WY-16]MDO7882211.1 AAA family ATPase [Protaetiibacter sp. WY-16]
MHTTPLALTVEGYKAIRDRSEIAVKPLTVISGANSSGKSSFFQPFLMMKQTLDSAFDPGPLLLYGPNVKVTEYGQILSRGKARTDVVDHFTVAIRQGDASREVRFVATQNGISIASDTARSGDAETVLSDPLTKKNIDRLREAHRDRVERYSRIFEKDLGDPIAEKVDFSVYRNRCFLEASLILRGSKRSYNFAITEDADDDRWVQFLRGIIHVPGLRGNPERAYSRSAVGATYPGTFETYVASIVYEWSVADSPLLNQLSAQLRELGLTWKLLARRLNDASIELLVGRTQHAQQGGAQDLVSVADVGFGVSQTLPVLVALLAAKPGQLVYIEQPEIHLHPRAQLALASTLVSAANRGVNVVAETHSSLLIRGIQTEIARGHLPAESLSLNWFARDPVTGFQVITEAEVDEAGRFGEWPVDFDDISREADWQYLDAVQDLDAGNER